jgi:hypothetical protein
MVESKVEGVAEVSVPSDLQRQQEQQKAWGVVEDVGKNGSEPPWCVGL